MKFITLLFFVFSWEVSFCQDEVNLTDLTRYGEVLPPSPNVSSLSRFGGLPLNMSSGKSNVSLPLYQIKTSNLEVPISLRYSTSGFKVDEIASRVGLSWSLDIGGVISRTVFDAPDENSTPVSVPQGFLSGLDNEETFNFLNQVQQGSFDQVDMQPDIFTYNFGSYQGKFIINGNSIFVFPHNNIKIQSSLIESNAADGYHFKIVAPDGVTYYFGGNGAYESSASESFGSNCSSNKDFNVTQTAWYLKKIVHPDGDIIEFFYLPVNTVYKASIHQSQTRRKRNSEIYHCAGTTTEFPADQTSTCITKILSYGVKLDHIVTSSGQTVTVGYRNRADLVNDFLVQDLFISNFNNASYLKHIVFGYDEVISNFYGNAWTQNDDELKKRYFLKSITEKSGPNDAIGQEYKFEYNDFSNLPPRLSFACDYWGFFNGKNNSTLLYLTDEAVGQNLNSLDNLYSLFSAGADRTPDPTYSQKGLLKKVVYPTGGYEEINYEGHNYKTQEQQPTNVQNNTVNINGTCNDEVTPTIIESSIFSPNQDQNSILTVHSSYYGQTGFEPSLDKVIYSLFNVTDGVFVVNETILYAGDGVVNEANKQVFLRAGKSYKSIIKIYGIEVSGSSSLPYQNFSLQTVTLNKIAGGVRVAKIATVDPIHNKTTVKKYLYSFLAEPNYSSCDNVNYNFDNLMVSNGLVPCSGATCLSDQAEYYNLSSSTYYNINIFSGEAICYKSVIESLGENFENGGTEYHFTSEIDQVPSRKFGTLPISSPFSNNDWSNGLLTYKRDFQKDGNSYVTQKEQITTYKTDTRINNNILGYIIRRNHATRCYTPINFPDEYGVTPFDVLEYRIQQRWVYPETVVTKNYSSDNTGTALTQNLLYQHLTTENFTPTNITIDNSKDELNILTTVYSSNLFSSSNQPIWLNNLQANNFGDAPIEQLKIKRKGGIDYVIGGQLVIYSNEFLKPAEIYNLQLSAPIPIADFQSCNIVNGVLVHDSRYQKKVEYNYNPNSGKLLEKTEKEDIQKESFIWDYHNELLIADVKNGKKSDIAFTSFESDGKGNWDYNGTISGPGPNDVPPTGTKYYNLTPGTPLTKTALLNGSKYIVSYWCKSGNQYNISGGTGASKKGRTLHGWTYFEHIITANSTTIYISGNGGIDEVRLYPAKAQMTTYTHEPLLGITSICDINNHISYFEYDNFNRLKLIKDEEGNILKTFDYQYQQLQQQ